MNLIKTKKTARPSSSQVEIKLHTPKAWHELTQEQLRYVLTLMSEGIEGDTLKAMMLIRFNHINVVMKE